MSKLFATKLYDEDPITQVLANDVRDAAVTSASDAENAAIFLKCRPPVRCSAVKTIDVSSRRNMAVRRILFCSHTDRRHSSDNAIVLCASGAWGAKAPKFSG